MEYRIHPRTGDKISVIGFGTGPIFEAPAQEAAAALTYVAATATALAQLLRLLVIFGGNGRRRRD